MSLRPKRSVGDLSQQLWDYVAVARPGRNHVILRKSWLSVIVL